MNTTALLSAVLPTKQILWSPGMEVRGSAQYYEFLTTAGKGISPDDLEHFV